MTAIAQTHRENRLARESSPYLLQHKHNPVDWWPWGPEALAAAKRTNKPILLSVGYAACHWCHVMAHESFEDEAVARVMNELFINIKVDREERPDTDQIYMSALHMLGEQGGWPLTMFLTPAGEPFWGGTYFPKTARYGRPAFVDMLREVARLFREEPSRIEHNRQALMERLAERARPQGQVVIARSDLDTLAQRIATVVDPVHGGLKGAPKFPQAALFELLWRAGQRTGETRYFGLVELTLERICNGGIYDHLGGGFSRYSVDERWLVPHFEKMLYDNAQLLELLGLAFARSQKSLFRDRARQTVEWLAREMTTTDGAFCASLDADSEGEEGKFYVWSLPEIEQALGPEDAAFFAKHYDVTPEGNFEGHNILNRLRDLRRRGSPGKPSRQAACGTRPAGAAGPRRQDSCRLERADDRRPAERRRLVRRAIVDRDGGTRLRVHCRCDVAWRPARPFLARRQADFSGARLGFRRDDPRRLGALRSHGGSHLSRARACVAAGIRPPLFRSGRLFPHRRRCRRAGGAPRPYPR